jgi:hypothetical protein
LNSEGASTASVATTLVSSRGPAGGRAAGKPPAIKASSHIKKASGSRFMDPT